MVDVKQVYPIVLICSLLIDNLLKSFDGKKLVSSIIEDSGPALLTAILSYFSSDKDSSVLKYIINLSNDKNKRNSNKILNDNHGNKHIIKLMEKRLKNNRYRLIKLILLKQLRLVAKSYEIDGNFITEKKLPGHRICAGLLDCVLLNALENVCKYVLNENTGYKGVIVTEITVQGLLTAILHVAVTSQDTFRHHAGLTVIFKKSLNLIILILESLVAKDIISLSTSMSKTIDPQLFVKINVLEEVLLFLGKQAPDTIGMLKKSRANSRVTRSSRKSADDYTTYEEDHRAKTPIDDLNLSMTKSPLVKASPLLKRRMLSLVVDSDSDITSATNTPKSARLDQHSAHLHCVITSRNNEFKGLLLKDKSIESYIKCYKEVFDLLTVSTKFAVAWIEAMSNLFVVKAPTHDVIAAFLKPAMATKIIHNSFLLSASCLFTPAMPANTINSLVLLLEEIQKSIKIIKRFGKRYKDDELKVKNNGKIPLNHLEKEYEHMKLEFLVAIGSF